MDRVKKAEIDIKREIGFIINNKVKDPRIGFVTVTGTRLSADFKWLDVFVSILGSKDKVEKSLNGLKNCGGFIKKKLQERIKLKNTPNLRFIHDQSIDRGMKITEILKDLNEGKN